MTVLFVRTLLVYVAVIGGLRFTGKRQLGELSTSEFAVTILVSELASVPLQDTAAPLLGGIVPLLTLLCVEVLLSCLCLRSRRVRHLVSGNSCVVIRDGRLDAEMLRLLRLSPEDVLEALRIAGVSRVEDVRCAIVETNGQLSVIPRAERQPLTPADLRLSPDPIGLPLVLIEDGRVDRDNLRRLGKSEDWLLELCQQRGLPSPGAIYLLTLDDRGNLFLQEKLRGNAS